MSGRRIIIVGAVIALGIAAWALWPRLGVFEAKSSAPQTPPAIPVSVASVTVGDFPVVINGLGLVQSLQTISVRSRIDGEITRIAFQEGQLVKAGDVLAEIDRRPFVAALDQARAKQAQDEANLANAKRDLERYTVLVDKNAGSRQQRDQQAATVSQLEFAIKADAALVDAAQTQLNYTTITAPIAGRTGFRQVDEGNYVSVGSLTPIVTITQISPIGVVFTAPGSRFEEIRDALESGKGEVVALTTDGKRALARGRLSLMDNQIDPLSGSIKLKAIFANDDGALWPGLPVLTRLQVAVRENAVLVPDVALQRGRDGLFAFVVEKDKVIRRIVEAAMIVDGRALVTKGLATGESVVTTGQFRLSDGASVSVQTERDANAPPRDGPT